MFKPATALGPIAVAALLIAPYLTALGSPPQSMISARQQENSEREATTQLVDSDLKFIQKVAKEGIADLSFGQVCLAKASDDEVRRFAQQIVDQQQQANQELKKLARTKGVTLPTSHDLSLHRKLTQMLRYSGAQFDREFSQLMLKKYERDVAAFERQQREAHDSELRAWIEKMLPALRDRYQLGHEIAQKMGVDVPPMDTALQKAVPR